MNVGKLYQNVQLLTELDTQTEAQTSLVALHNSLVNLSGQPQHQTFQLAVSTALTKVRDAFAKLNASLTPAQHEFIDSIGGKGLFDTSVSEAIEDTFSHNAVTPIVISQK